MIYSSQELSRASRVIDFVCNMLGKKYVDAEVLEVLAATCSISTLLLKANQAETEGEKR